MTTGRRSCRRKRRHDTREQAQAALTALLRTRFASPYYMHAYHCRWCHGWHIGHRLGYGARR